MSDAVGSRTLQAVIERGKAGRTGMLLLHGQFGNGRLRAEAAESALSVLRVELESIIDSATDGRPCAEWLIERVAQAKKQLAEVK